MKQNVKVLRTFDTDFRKSYFFALFNSWKKSFLYYRSFEAWSAISTAFIIFKVKIHFLKLEFAMWEGNIFISLTRATEDQFSWGGCGFFYFIYLENYVDILAAMQVNEPVEAFWGVALRDVESRVLKCSSLGYLTIKVTQVGNGHLIWFMIIIIQDINYNVISFSILKTYIYSFSTLEAW